MTPIAPMPAMPPTPPVQLVARAGGVAVAREAGYVDGRLAWLHRARGGAETGMAALISAGLFWDGLHGHHPGRRLADALAAAGIPTLRIDHPGCGDAVDLPAGADAWAAWQAGLDTAADWLRHHTGAGRLLLCGMRLGGTLAALLAARRTDVAGLLLVSPVLRGRSYLRQLRIEAQMEEQAAALADGGLAFQEHVLTGPACRALEAVDLAACPLPAGLAVAIAMPGASTLADRTVAAWTQGGAACTVLPHDGLAPLVAFDPAILPPPDFTAVLAWAAAIGPAAAAPPPPSLQADARLAQDRWVEQPVQFGDGGRLFAIHTKPADPAAASGIGVLIVNSGCEPHYGIGRFGVDCARRLAAAGIASLRMDLAGLGDSGPAPGDPDDLPGTLLDTPRGADIAAGLDLLAQGGATILAVHGLCAGAYHAWHAALADARVRRLLLVNLPLFVWPVVAAPHPSASLVPAALARLAAQGARCVFVFSPDDPGLAELELELGPAGTVPDRHPGTCLQVLAGMNHNVSAAPMRAALAALLTRALTEDVP